MNEASSSLTQLALQKFKKNFWGVFSFYFVIVCGLIAIFAYVLAPDASQNANQMHLSIHSKPPGFKVTMLTVPTSNKFKQTFLSKFLFGVKTNDSEIPISSYKIEGNTLLIQEFMDNSGIQGMEKTIPLTNYPENLSTEAIVSKYIVSKKFLLGTDKYGRDLLSRMLIGTRISFSIGFIAVFISLVIGILLGAIAGYYGGKIDAFIMWIINVTWSIPTLLLVIAITLTLGKGFWQVFIAVGLTMWVEVARVVRGQVLGANSSIYYLM